MLAGGIDVEALMFNSCLETAPAALNRPRR
jgi:hypothetical protein